jgi:(3,5-dihydroxyphenyl)acetyl-CoA 1,2-dioxygenase
MAPASDRSTSKEKAMASTSAQAAIASPPNDARWPPISGDYVADSAALSRHWLDSLALLDRMPARKDRTADQKTVAEALLTDARKSRGHFLAAHGGRFYRDLTEDLRCLRRVEDLAFAAGEKLPGLCPTAERVARELSLPHADKDGHEVDQGLFFNSVLADRECGLHLCHAMLLPRRESVEKLERLRAQGRLDMDHASVERFGKASIVSLKNSRYLNAEDDSTIKDVETAVDLAIMDPETSVCVLRGGVIDAGKYAGRRVFCSGVNLTHIYYGRLSYIWYLVRDMGFVNKIYRGLASPDIRPDEMLGETIEKPWIAAVDTFAIGGGCQYLLAADYNIAADDSYMTLPARKEGIVPGAANMRLPRFVGDRIARQAIMAELRINCDSEVGRLICDVIVRPDQMNAAIGDAIERLTSSGVVSASSNRKAMRVVQEPLDMFRSYMSVYAREQAYCHFSPALISNLEQFWNAKNRKM